MSDLDRREFLKLAAIGSFGLVIGLPKVAAAASPDSELHPLIRIGSDGTITLYAQNPEMGQGVKTALPMIIAEELDVDWASIDVEQADWDTRLDNQFSGGSLSVRLNYTTMRQAGATARRALGARRARAARPDRRAARSRASAARGSFVRIRRRR